MTFAEHAWASFLGHFKMWDRWVFLGIGVVLLAAIVGAAGWYLGVGNDSGVSAAIELCNRGSFNGWDLKRMADLEWPNAAPDAKTDYMMRVENEVRSRCPNSYKQN